MKTQYRINDAAKLANGSTMISGSVISGPRLVAGREGKAITAERNIRVLVIGTGVIDPNLVPPDRQGILVNLLEGEVGMLKGLVLEFNESNESAS